MANMVPLTGSQIRYLLTIKRLNRGCGIRSVDVANALNISRPSVHCMMNSLLELDYITKKPHQLVFLTEKGHEQATLFEVYYGLVAEKLRLSHPHEHPFDKAICALLGELSNGSLEALA